MSEAVEGRCHGVHQNEWLGYLREACEMDGASAEPITPGRVAGWVSPRFLFQAGCGRASSRPQPARVVRLLQRPAVKHQLAEEFLALLGVLDAGYPSVGDLDAE